MIVLGGLLGTAAGCAVSLFIVAHYQIHDPAHAALICIPICWTLALCGLVAGNARGRR